MHFQAGRPLTAGQVNTIAHQGTQLIEEKVLTSSTTSIVTFSAIPQTFQNLWLLVSASTGSTGVDGLVMRFNGDAALNYTTHLTQHTGAGAVSDFYGTASWLRAGLLLKNDLGAQNSTFIPGYSDTSREKSELTTFSAPDSASYLGLCGGLWNSTSAITSIDLLERPDTAADNFIPGSLFMLYGLGVA